MTIEEQFLEDYKELYNIILESYGKSIADLQDSNELSKKDNDTLQSLRQLRNILVHSNFAEKEYLILTPDMISHQREIISMFSEVFMSKAIQKDVFCCQHDETVQYGISTMIECDYTHLPIVDEYEHILGVFSENSMLAMLKDGVKIDETVTFDDIWDYVIKPDDVYRKYDIVSSAASYHDCQEMFKADNPNQPPVDMLLVTQDGTAGTSIMGILTACDLAGK